MWIELVAYLSERTVCACVKWVSVTSRLSCRVFNPHFGTSEFGTFGFRTNSAFRKNRPSHKLRFRTYPILFYLNQIRNVYYFLVKTCFQNNICHHHIHKMFFKISFLAIRGKNCTCKTDRRLQLRAKMICQGCRTKTWAAEELAWTKADSHWPVPVDWIGGLFDRAQSCRLCQMKMSKCHFTIIMSCVQSTLRNFGIRYIRFSDKFGFRKKSAFA